VNTSPSAVAPSPSQKQALLAFSQALESSNECFILRGGAGTGKSRMIAWLVALVDPYAIFAVTVISVPDCAGAGA